MTVIAQDDHLTAGAWAACGLFGKWFTCKHSQLPILHDYVSFQRFRQLSLNVLKFLIDIFEKTKANHLALESLTSIFNPTVSFETRNLCTFLLRFFRSIISSLVNDYYLISFLFQSFSFKHIMFHISTL